MTSLQERIHTFGKDNCLVGIHCAGHDNKFPAVLFWNAGLLHRVGPNRLYVDLARRLSKLGFHTFRFDLSGLGDSQQRKDTLTEEARTITEINDAMDLLKKETQVSHFILIGLCSGAFNAHQSTFQNNNIIGTVFLDGFAYRTWRFYWYYVIKRLKAPRFWKKLLIHPYRRTGTRFNENLIKEGTFIQQYPPRERVKSEIVQCIKRGVRLLYIYSSGSHQYYNYQNQFVDMYHPIETKGLIEFEYYYEADHTYTLLEDRKKLMDRICRWLQIYFTQ
ncbi:MAG: hypothetical protein Q8Q33_05295 [Chlamydiota bacterium]|nr:hypothetical protein [Chlamydiota bacterium]